MAVLSGVGVVGHELQQLDHVIARLVSAYPDLGEGEVRLAVMSAFDGFADARVRQFVPVLVERAARASCSLRLTSRTTGREGLGYVEIA